MNKKLLFGGALAIVLGLTMASGVSAEHISSTVVVTPTNTQGWSTADTRPGGAVNFVMDATSPYPNGALQLTTNLTTTSKAQYLHGATGSLNSVTELGYSTRQVSGPIVADPSYQLIVDLNGAGTGGFTTFVYEPYQNGVIIPNVWQTWDVDAGMFWSTRNFSEGTCTIVAGGGGPPFYTLAQLQTNCPNATVLGFGVNIGSNNPGYNVYTDGVNFNGTVYDFQLFATAMNKDQCKNGGFMNVKDSDGKSFKNQGQCVSSVSDDDSDDEDEDEDDD